MMFIHQITFKIRGKITGPQNISQGDHLLCCQSWCLTQNQYSKYRINPWNSLEDIRQKHCSIDHSDLDLITLNVDVINMSDAQPSLRSCLHKQTATYYFIGPPWLSWMCRPIGDQEVAASTLAEVGNILSWDWSWKKFYGHSLPSSDSRRAVVSFWQKNVHNTG